MSTASASALSTIVERMGLKTLVESCLVLEEGVASAKDIEIGMMMGAGILPGPFSRADEAGPVRPRGRGGAGHDPRAARARRGRVGAVVRAADRAAPAGGSGPARQE